MYYFKFFDLITAMIMANWPIGMFIFLLLYKLAEKLAEKLVDKFIERFVDKLFDSWDQETPRK